MFERTLSSRKGRENLPPLSPEGAIRTLERLLGWETQALVTAFPTAFLQAAGLPLFQGLQKISSEKTVQQNFRTELEKTPKDAQELLLHQHIESTILRVLGMPSSTRLDRETPFTALGLDSLMAIEVRTQLGNSLNMRLPATMLFDHPSISQLSTHLLTHLEPSS